MKNTESSYKRIEAVKFLLANDINDDVYMQLVENAYGIATNYLVLCGSSITDNDNKFEELMNAFKRDFEVLACAIHSMRRDVYNVTKKNYQ